MKVRIAGWLGGVVALVALIVYLIAYLAIPIGIVWAIFKYCLS